MTSETGGWPAALPVGSVRVARPTHQLDQVVRFYRDGLGLTQLGSFERHAGYRGVFFGLPGHAHHLEFTEHDDGERSRAPTADNLLVFYFTTDKAVDDIKRRLAGMGYAPVAPENPYWERVERSVTIEDPDGWRIVLVKPRPGSRPS